MVLTEAYPKFANAFILIAGPKHIQHNAISRFTLLKEHTMKLKSSSWSKLQQRFDEMLLLDSGCNEVSENFGLYVLKVHTVEKQ